MHNLYSYTSCTFNGGETPCLRRIRSAEVASDIATVTRPNAIRDERGEL